MWLPFAIRQNETKSAVVSSAVSKCAWETAVTWEKKAFGRMRGNGVRASWNVSERSSESLPSWKTNVVMKLLLDVGQSDENFNSYGNFSLSGIVVKTWFNFPNNWRNSRGAVESLIKSLERDPQALWDQCCGKGDEKCNVKNLMYNNLVFPNFRTVLVYIGIYMEWGSCS